MALPVQYTRESSPVHGPHRGLGVASVSMNSMLLRLLGRLRADLAARRMWGNSLLVLMYHYFTPASRSEDPLVVTTGDLRRQFEYLKRHYSLRSLASAVRDLKQGRALPRNCVAITVDDVGADFGEHAWPAVREFEIPICLAICPAFADPALRWERLFAVTHPHLRREPRQLDALAAALGIEPFDFPASFERLREVPADRLEQALRSIGIESRGDRPLPGSIRLPALGFDALESMSAGGLVEIASHTMTHPPCSRISEVWLRWEVQQAREAIVARFGDCPLFVYPGGARTQPTELGDRVLREAGHEAALTIVPALATDHSAFDALGRVGVYGEEPFEVFRVRVAGLTALIGGVRGRNRPPVENLRSTSLAIEGRRPMPVIPRLFSICLLLATSAAPALAEAQWMRYPAISPDGESIVFSYRGDLWRVDADGGKALALTRHAAHDTQPVWSRDGGRLAFASDRYGNFDIFAMPAGGGVATRLTFHSATDLPSAFTPDDSAVVFSSSRLDGVTSVQYPTGAQPELYAVSLAGGMPRQLLSTPAIHAIHDRAGKRLVYSDLKGYEDDWRKHDDSSFARDLWMLDVDSGEHRRLTGFGHDDRQPVWSADEQALYFLSERSGSFNVWRMELSDPEHPRQITHHEKHPVRFLSVSRQDRLCYAFDGSLYTRAPGENESRRLTIDAPADLIANDLQHIDVAQEISEFEISPDGKEMVFVARGELFVTSTDHAVTRRITETPEQERSVSFAPDGRSLLYASERNGSWNLYRSSLGDPDEPNFFNATLIEEQPVLEIEAETFQPRYSPDGKEVAYLQERTELRVLNLESGETRRIVPPELNYSYIDGDQWYQWSPDGSQFLVSFLSPTRWSYEIGLVPASGKGEVINLTRGGYEDYSPRWALEGKAMFWFTDRFGGRLQAGWPSEYDVRLAFFTQQAWDRFRLSEAEMEQVKAREEKEKKKKEESEAEEKKKDKKPKEEEKPKLPDPVAVEVEGLEDRTVRLTIHSSDMADAVLTPDGEKLLYLARFEKGYDLWSYAHRKQEIKLLAKLNAKRAGNLYLDKEGTKAFLLVDGSLKTVTIESGEVKPVALSAPMALDARAERAYLFEHAWRQTLKKFHDVEMHGVDWQFYKSSYARFLDEVDNNHDFAELLSEMLGELNASHTGSGYRPPNGQGDQTASLGFFPDVDWQGAGIRIAEILEGGPLQQSGSRIAVGSVIEAIDGVAIAVGENWYPRLNRKADQPLRLTLRAPGSDESWQERVKPIDRGREGELLYERWLRGRRAEVDRLSGGRIGYAHIRGMDDRSFRVIFEDIFGESVTKEAIVLDTRFNGGGNLDEALTAFLSGKIYMTAVPRGQKVGAEPSLRWTKPSIVVQNEGNYSDAHCFPNAYRTLGLGQTVGMQVPGTCTAVWWETLQDRTLYFGIPQVTWTDVAGDALENKHFDPDFEVDNDPRLESAGRDQQLEKAVAVLLEGLP